MDAALKKGWVYREMGRRALLILTMVLTLALASGTAMAQEAEVDQEQLTHDGAIAIDRLGTYQYFTAGKNGTLSKISVPIGCCRGEGNPTGNLRVVVAGVTVDIPVMVPSGG
jgi:hypothetical protein